MAAVLAVWGWGFEVPNSEAVVLRHDRDPDRTLELGARYPFFCRAGGGSGTLIRPRWVLTAAHVAEAFSPFDFRVRCGHLVSAVSRTFVHPGESLAASTMEERLADYREAHREWGRLHPKRFVVTAPEEIFVLVESSIGEMVFGFTVEAEAPHALVSYSVSY